MTDEDILARTIFGEARGEGLEGMEAVACVIMNRFKAEKWFTGYVVINGQKIPNVAETCLKKAQFSCWNKNDSNYKILQNINANNMLFKQCIMVAKRALKGELIDFTNGALYYHTKQIKPKWAIGKSPCYSVKNHLFYNDI